MIRTHLINAETGLVQSGGLELVQTWKSSADLMLWLDMQDVEPRQEYELLEAFGIHALAIQDAQRKRHPPKLEVFNEHTFLLIRGLDAHSTSIDLQTIHISMFISDRFLITRHSGDSVSIDSHWAMIGEDDEFTRAGPATWCTNVATQSSKRYIPILLGLESRLAELEDDLMAKPSDEKLAELVGYKTRLRRLRRIFSYHERVFHRLLNEQVDHFPEALHHQIHDIYEAVERSRSLSDMYYEVTGDLIEGYISIASHRLNQIMKVLTIVTTIFVPLGFLAGIYGMNFEYIPELGFRYGYFVLLSVMASIATGLMFVFRRRKWI